MFFDYTMWGIVVEMDIYKQSIFVVLCITWSFKFHY
jgi:hypothetical protein